MKRRYFIYYMEWQKWVPLMEGEIGARLIVTYKSKKDAKATIEKYKHRAKWWQIMKVFETCP